MPKKTKTDAAVTAISGENEYPSGTHEEFLDTNNVSVVEQVVNMITAQRAHEDLSKGIAATDAPVTEDISDVLQMWDVRNEIHDLVKLRAALSFGTKTGTKDKAESVLSRAINKRVGKLGEMCIKKFDDKNR